MHFKKINAHTYIYFHLLNYVMQKFQYSVKLWLFDNRMNSNN